MKKLNYEEHNMRNINYKEHKQAVDAAPKKTGSLNIVV